MSEPASSTIPGFIVSPAGGALIGLLLFPTGCAEYVAILTCAADAQTNLFGWTLGGIVGNVSEAGAAVIGFCVAVAIYSALRMYEESQESPGA